VISSEQPYPVVETRIDPRSPEYRANHEANAAAVAKLRAALADATVGGGEKYASRHRAAGKLLPRERVELLLDRDAYFLELCALAGRDVPGHTTGAGFIGGVGKVSGVECVITANDSTVKGGAFSELTGAKSARCNDVAEANRLPTISLVESAGADLPNQHKIFVPGGRGFRDLTRRSQSRIPTICLVFGSSTAGGAYVPGMSDYVVMVQNQAQVYLAGPPLVKMATGEDADDEQLGGARMHSEVSGLSDQFAADERDCLRIGREVVADLGWRKLGPGPSRPPDEPLYDREELLGLTPADFRIPVDPREILARIVDGSRFSEYKGRYGTSLVTGWASIHGFPVGVLANHRGVLFSEEAKKASEFILLANQTDTPLIFLQNTTGYMVGTTYEQGGIIKDGAKMINAVANSAVPHFTINIGASFGAGNYGMSGRAYDPRLMFAWANARLAVMGAQQLAGVLSIVGRQAADAAGREFDAAADTERRRDIEAQIERESHAFFVTARLYDDGVIDPRDTRTVLAIGLSAAHSQVIEGRCGFGVFRM